jgi:A/G-specific adenine glycosylase
VETADRKRLLAWYRRNRRDLPWRRTRDPYAIWVSEAMLQQTRVETVVPYFQRWMARFPTLQALAEAPEEQVLRSWSGLGYYTRARNLHRGAQAMVESHGGKLPRTVEELRLVPGIGPYTAAAVASIAFGEPVACVDGNVVRVATRIAGLRGAIDSRMRRRIEGLAQRWLDAKSPGDWNQAMMELGATLCTPRNPRCISCPVASSCTANARGWQADIPRKVAKKPPVPEEMQFAVVVQDDRVLMVRNSGRGLLAGLWSLPGGPAGGPLSVQVKRQTGVGVRGEPAPSARVRHAFSHRTWSMQVHRAHAEPGGHRRPEAAWMALADLPGAALSVAMRKALRAGGLKA